MSSLISHQQLQNAKRVLYMTHLALGDFVYQSVWLQALKAKYPHLTLDIWFDDCRRKPKHWAAGRNKVLSDWIESLDIAEHIYPIVADLDERQSHIKKAASLNYDIIVYIGKNSTEQFIKVARQISKTAFVVGTQSKPWNNPIAKWWYFKQANGHFSYDAIAQASTHITDLYKTCFYQALGLTEQDLLQGSKHLLMEVSADYQAEAKAFVLSLKKGDSTKPVTMINHLSTASKKDYPFEKVRQLILRLRQLYPSMVFVINCPPDKLNDVTTELAEDKQLNTLPVVTFTAKRHFFQLPALIAEMDMMVTVDTATAHLAVCMSVPHVTLMANDFALWQPQGIGKIIEGDGQARSINVDQVVTAFQSLYDVKS